MSVLDANILFAPGFPPGRTCYVAAKRHRRAFGRGSTRSFLQIDDGLLPSHFTQKELYREDWVCAVAKEPFCDRDFAERVTWPRATSLWERMVGRADYSRQADGGGLGEAPNSAFALPYLGGIAMPSGRRLVLTRPWFWMPAVKANAKCGW